MIVCLGVPALAYNSEEHKLIGDKGAAVAATCESLQRAGAPVQNGRWGCGVFGNLNRTRSQVPLLKSYDATVGPPSNCESEGSGFIPGQQPELVTYEWQRCYKSWGLEENRKYKTQAQGLHSVTTPLGQDKDQDFNKTLYIPRQDDTTLKSLEPLVVWVGTADGKKGTYFTFGDLVALYGDYRKAVTCDEKRHDCLLTDNVLPDDTAKTVHGYLRSFAHGVTPPIDLLGNSATGWEPYEKDSQPQSDKFGWWGDEMMRLAGVNDWHFSDVAVSWYVAMHRLALRHAMLAVKNNDPTSLWKAIHYEANGLHSITDLFSPGHMVVNRKASTQEIWSGVPGYEQNPLRVWGTRVAELGVLGDIASGKEELDAPSSSWAPTSVKLTSMKLKKPYALWAKWEESGHSSFNKNGAQGRTLAGTEFYIYGDSRLFGRRNPEQPDVDPGPPYSAELFKNSSEAVQVGLRSLLDAYSVMKAGGVTRLDATYRGLENNRARYFAALQYIPTELRRACYGNSEFCYGPGENGGGRWRLTTYRNPIAAFLGMPLAPTDSQLPSIDGKRRVIDPIYLAAYSGSSTLNSVLGWFGGKSTTLRYALQKGEKGYQFDEGKGRLVCEEHGLPAYEFSVLPWK
ncbi:Hypothetical protein AA314_04105 [Archangium gephyra]|uniref:Uncharacterized protein n=1 Tax=Archangium gephyra TaxID=48 RepID=A0AAC8Q7K8_9BACT|nr:Hypothetical protein AA314_04105 [Archangium gephyra]